MFFLVIRLKLARGLKRLGGSIQNAENIVLAHDDVLQAIQFDLVAGILPEQNTGADLDVESDHLAAVETLAVPDSHHFALLGLLFSRIGDDDAVALGLLLLDPLHYNAVV